MTEIPVEFEFRIVSEGGGDPSDEIAEMILGWPNVKPHAVIVDDEKAAYIEFGTGPAKSTGKKYGPDRVSPVEQRIREWVRLKQGISDRKMCYEIAHNIYKKIMNKGLAPMPFFRSSYYKVIDEVCPADGSPSDWLDNGTIESLAEYIASTVVDTIYDLDMIYTGELAESVRVEPRDLTQGDEISDSNGIVDPTLWNDPELGINGKKPPQRFYGV